MPSQFQTLLYIARLSKLEMATVFEHDDAFPQSHLRTTLISGVEDVCVDRLIRAENCLNLAIHLGRTGNEEEWLRAAVGRAYYSIHHSLRTIALWENKWDPDGHEESIKQFKELLNDEAFRRKSGLAPNDREHVAQARDNRHIADYSPYDEQRQ